MTAKQIDNLSIEELEQLAEGLTREENELWAYWGYEGRTYELIMRNRAFVKSAREHWYNNDMTAEQLFNLITTQTFADFYNNELEDYVTGEGNAMSKEDIVSNLRELMNLYK